jgi:hypothetical protein
MTSHILRKGVRRRLDYVSAFLSVSLSKRKTCCACEMIYSSIGPAFKMCSPSSSCTSICCWCSLRLANTLVALPGEWAQIVHHPFASLHLYLYIAANAEYVYTWVGVGGCSAILMPFCAVHTVVQDPGHEPWTDPRTNPGTVRRTAPSCEQHVPCPHPCPDPCPSNSTCRIFRADMGPDMVHEPSCEQYKVQCLVHCPFDDYCMYHGMNHGHVLGTEPRTAPSFVRRFVPWLKKCLPDVYLVLSVDLSVVHVRGLAPPCEQHICRRPCVPCCQGPRLLSTVTSSPEALAGAWNRPNSSPTRRKWCLKGPEVIW